MTQPNIEKMAFFSDMLEDGYDLRLRVTGTSMAPFLETGSYVTISKSPICDLKIGDIIFCRCGDGSYKLHRLIAMENEMLITQGDALYLPDQPFEKKDYQGKVIRIEYYRPHAIKSRNMESPYVQATNYLVAVFFRLKFHRVCKYIGLKFKFA